MRILSNFHDYYDPVRIYGQDPQLRYIRETREIKPLTPLKSLLEKEPPIPRFLGKQRILSDELSVRTGVIAFCGIAHYVTQVTIGGTRRTFHGDEFFRFIAGYRGKDPTLRQIKASISTRHYYWSAYDFSEKGFSEFMHKVSSLDLTELHRKVDAPVVAMIRKQDGPLKQRDASCVINPVLRDYDFARVVDPFQAFQQISMFIGSMLAKQVDPPARLTDKLMRDSKGFDDQSFKQLAPGRKKARRLENRLRKKSRSK